MFEGGGERLLRLKRPSTVKDISTVLINRFKVRDTPAGLTQKLCGSFQGNWSVSKFASVIESITADLIEQLANSAESAREVVQSLADDLACEAFKAGLSPDIQNIVLEAQVTSFSDALNKASAAEASLKSTSAQINVFRQQSRGSITMGDSKIGIHSTGTTGKIIRARIKTLLIRVITLLPMVQADIRAMITISRVKDVARLLILIIITIILVGASLRTNIIGRIMVGTTHIEAMELVVCG